MKFELNLKKLELAQHCSLCFSCRYDAKKKVKFLNNNKYCANNTKGEQRIQNEGVVLLLQQHRRSPHEGDPSPVPDHDDEDAGCEECLHGKPNFGEASILVDALEEEEKKNRSKLFVSCIWVNQFVGGLSQSKRQTYNETNVFDFSDPHVDLLPLINRQPDVEEIVLVGHAADLHEREWVTLVVTSLILKGLG